MPAVVSTIYHHIPSKSFRGMRTSTTFQWHGPSPKSPQEVAELTTSHYCRAALRYGEEIHPQRELPPGTAGEDGGINSVWNRRPQDGRIGAKTSITITWTIRIWLFGLFGFLHDPFVQLQYPKACPVRLWHWKIPGVSGFGGWWKIHPKCLVLEWFGTSNQADFWQPGILGPHLLGIWGQLPLDRGSEAIGIWFRGAGPRALTGAPLAVTKILHKSLELTVDRRLCLIASIGQSWINSKTMWSPPLYCGVMAGTLIWTYPNIVVWYFFVIRK